MRSIVRTGGGGLPIVTWKDGMENEGTLGTVIEMFTTPGVTPLTVPLNVPSELPAFTVALPLSTDHASGIDRGWPN